MSGFFGVVMLLLGTFGLVVGIAALVRAFIRNTRYSEPSQLLVPPFDGWRHPFASNFLAGSALASAGFIAMCLGLRLLR